MKYGFCNISIVPVRHSPDDKSEMTTQVLFGELLLIEEIKKNWSKVRLHFDNYEGWIDTKQYLLIDQKTYDILKTARQFTAKNLINEIIANDTDTVIQGVIGSSLPDLNSQKIKVGDIEYLYREEAICIADINPEEIRKHMVNTAMSYLNTPYLWGGRTPFGIDCSGLSQMVYKINGIKLLRDASQQAGQGETLSFISEALPGDLAFFDNSEGDIIHVGIILENSKIIHASGKVRIDTIDHHGIYNSEIKAYTHKLRIIKSMI